MADISSATASPSSPVETFALPLFTTTALSCERSCALRHDHGRRNQRVASEAGRRDGAVLVADEQSDVELARRLDPAATPAARNPAGSSAGLELAHARRTVDPAAAEKRAQG